MRANLGNADTRRPPELLKRTGCRRERSSSSAFTILELLIVVAIIGILAAIALPGMKGIGQSNTMSSANRQLLDDLAYARQRAISEQTTVHVVFVPPTIYMMMPNQASARDKSNYSKLLAGPFTTYALYAERTVGDQPGRPFHRYLTEWKTLPDGVFIADWEFEVLTQAQWDARTTALDRPFKYTNLPFPSSEGAQLSVPHIAFDSQGRLVREGNLLEPEEYINLARGSTFVERNAAGVPVNIDVQERPYGNSITNYNRIRIDAYSGRATLERPEITL